METLIRQTLGQTLRDWTTELGKLDTERCECLRKNIHLFIEFQAESFLKLDRTEEIRRLLESVSTQSIEPKFLTGEEIELLVRVNNDPDPFQSLVQWEPKAGPSMPLTVKTGVLYKETGVFREWHRLFVVLTNTHFLHFFTTSDFDNFQEPILSVFLSAYKVFVSGDGFVFNLVESKPTSFLSIMSSPGLHTLKAETAEEMNEWMQALTKYIL